MLKDLVTAPAAYGKMIRWTPALTASRMATVIRREINQLRRSAHAEGIPLNESLTVGINLRYGNWNTVERKLTIKRSKRRSRR